MRKRNRVARKPCRQGLRGKDGMWTDESGKRLDSGLLLLEHCKLYGFSFILIALLVLFLFCFILLFEQKTGRILGQDVGSGQTGTVLDTITISALL